MASRENVRARKKRWGMCRGKSTTVTTTTDADDGCDDVSAVAE